MRKLAILLAVLLTACGEPAIRYELEISGTGTNIAVGETKKVRVFYTIYNEGEPYLEGEYRASDPERLEWTVGNASVLRAGIGDEFGYPIFVIEGLAPGRSTLAVRDTEHPEAYHEVVLQVP